MAGHTTQNFPQQANNSYGTTAGSIIYTCAAALLTTIITKQPMQLNHLAQAFREQMTIHTVYILYTS